MKNYFFLVIIFCISCYTGCSLKRNKNNINYIKVIAFGEADTITRYNKGIGLDVFAYYEPETDSLLYISKNRIDTSNNGTFSARLQGTLYRDTFLNIVKTLQKLKPGNSVDTTFVYCIDPIYIEYSVDNKVYYHYFIQNGDTINNFCNLVFNFSHRSLKKRDLSDRLSAIDTQGVNAMKRVGEYDKKEEPYIPVSCDSSINKEKVYGSWRLTYQGFNHKNSFTKATFSKNGTYLFEKVREGIGHKRQEILNFSIRSRDSLFIVTTKGQESRLTILKLTDSCFFLKKENNEVIMFNRL